MKVLITKGLWDDPDYYLNLGDERHRVAVQLPADDLPRLHEFVRTLAAAEHDRGSIDYLEELDLPSGRLVLRAHALRRELVLDFGTTDCTVLYDPDLLDRILRQTAPPCQCRCRPPADGPDRHDDGGLVQGSQAGRHEPGQGDEVPPPQHDSPPAGAGTVPDEFTPDEQERLDRAMHRLRASGEHRALPASVRAAAEARPPWFLYRIRSTGRRGVLAGVGEAPDGRVTFEVACHLKYNPGWGVPKGHLVFGLGPDDIEPVEVLWDVADRV